MVFAVNFIPNSSSTVFTIPVRHRPMKTHKPLLSSARLRTQQNLMKHGLRWQRTDRLHEGSSRGRRLEESWAVLDLTFSWFLWQMLSCHTHLSHSPIEFLLPANSVLNSAASDKPRHLEIIDDLFGNCGQRRTSRCPREYLRLCGKKIHHSHEIEAMHQRDS